MAVPISRSLDFSEVPIIDIGPLVAGDAAAMPRVVEAIRQACEHIGFMYVTNHGVPRPVLDAMARQSERFFALPLAEKMGVAVAKSPQFRGYLPLEYAGEASRGQKGPSLQEGFIIMHDRPLGDIPLYGPNQWPAALPELRPAMLGYFAAVERLAYRMLVGFTLALGLKPDYFMRFYDEPMMMLKLNHYPPQDPADTSGKIGVVGHSDGGGFTILWQDDLGGLEVINKRGEWVGVPPIDGTFVVNIGDTMQMWTNGRFASTSHRVINRYGRNRYSTPLFVNPNYATVIEPIAETPDWQPVVSGEYMHAIYRSIFPQESATPV